MAQPAWKCLNWDLDTEGSDPVEIKSKLDASDSKYTHLRITKKQRRADKVHHEDPADEMMEEQMLPLRMHWRTKGLKTVLVSRSTEDIGDGTDRMELMLRLEP